MRFLSIFDAARAGRTVLCCLLFAIVGVSAGCGQVTVWWVDSPGADALDTFSQDFKKNMETECGSYFVVKKLNTEEFEQVINDNFRKANTDFDIVVIPSHWLGRGAAAGIYENLTDWLPGVAEGDNAIHPTLQKLMCEYPEGSGKYYGVPCNPDFPGFAYRKDWFANPPQELLQFWNNEKLPHEPPATWGAHLRIVQDFHYPPFSYGCTLLTATGGEDILHGFGSFLTSYGASWGNPKTYAVKGVLNGSKAEAALLAMKERLKYAWDPGADGVNAEKAYSSFVGENDLLGGYVATSMNYFSWFGKTVETMGEDVVGFYPIPYDSGVSGVSFAGQTFCISSQISDSRKDKAKRALQWFLQRRNQEEWMKQDGAFPCNKDLLGSIAFRDAHPYNTAFAESMESLTGFWKVPQVNEMVEAVRLYIGSAIKGAEEPKAALDSLANDFDAQLQ